MLSPFQCVKDCKNKPKCFQYGWSFTLRSHERYRESENYVIIFIVVSFHNISIEIAMELFAALMYRSIFDISPWEHVGGGISNRQFSMNDNKETIPLGY